jgi:uncharacterized protein
MEKNNLVNSNLTKIQQESLFIDIQHLICKKVSEFGHSKKEIKDLVLSGFNIDYVPEKQWSLLMMATYFNHQKLVSLFVELNANMEYQDKNGANALMVSIANQSIECFSLLLNNKVNLNVQDKNGVTPFLHACEVGNEYIINELITHGADISIKDYNGLGLLDYAKRCQNKTEAVHALIEKHSLENSIEVPVVNDDIQQPRKKLKI